MPSVMDVPSKQLGWMSGGEGTKPSMIHTTYVSACLGVGGGGSSEKLCSEAGPMTSPSLVTCIREAVMHRQIGTQW
jgi:hypothetical protein